MVLFVCGRKNIQLGVLFFYETYVQKNIIIARFNRLRCMCDFFRIFCLNRLELYCYSIWKRWESKHQCKYLTDK